MNKFASAFDGSLLSTNPRNDQANSLLSNQKSAHFPGCNATTWKQIPGLPNHFIGRVMRDTPNNNLDACAPQEFYTLAWAEMEWATNRLRYVGKIVDLNSMPITLQGSKYRILTAYDPSIIFDGKTIG